MGLLHKIAAKTNNTVLSDAAHLAGTIGATTAGVMAADKLIGGAGAQAFKLKIPSLIRYAKKKHSELGEVGDAKLKSWVMAIYTLSPRIAHNQELVADALYQIYQYGGNFDLATSKILADINKGTKVDNNLPYITAANSIQKRK